MNLLPGLSIRDLDDMSLLEIDSRLAYILETTRERQKGFLRDLSSMIFYGVSYGYASVRGKANNNSEKNFHQTIAKLLDPENHLQETQSNDPEDALSLFN